jgi:peptide methionine sulfoxide reductase MsrA
MDMVMMMKKMLLNRNCFWGVGAVLKYDKGFLLLHQRCDGGN